MSIYLKQKRSTQQQSDDYRSARDSNEYDSDNNNNNNLNMMSSNFRGPYFDTSVSKNVTALVGKTAYLNCRVRNLGNKTNFPKAKFFCLFQNSFLGKKRKWRNISVGIFFLFFFFTARKIFYDD
ncbi:hypothetical protein Phum_PHUM371240 [Pediculus humanus corporis]|uniref:Ig-like domain-containing protein n=1 Tax=Pediculus humanus subsp. corporis TaxID=121224 RepID=E0VQ42_PEDHC|nr:uncharacterized protein Phum_PHUM371240 [Pediculus humanus corporis]EEB15498.1 hypothetical protein Phum_PHUM371240 [Pediculus humanus corporis]